MNYQEFLEVLNRENQNWQATGNNRTQESTAAREWWANQQSGGGGAPAPAPPPPPPPPPKGQDSVNYAVKIPEANIVTWGTLDGMTAEQLEQMYFQSIGGTEILSVARHDNINGEKTIYSNISNVDEVQKNFNSTNLMLSNDILSIFNKFAIDISQKIENLGMAVVTTSDSIVVYLDNVKEDEYVQIQVASAHQSFDLEP